MAAERNCAPGHFSRHHRLRIDHG
jgi:hypothetical protein